MSKEKTEHNNQMKNKVLIAVVVVLIPVLVSLVAYFTYHCILTFT